MAIRGQLFLKVEQSLKSCHHTIVQTGILAGTCCTFPLAIHFLLQQSLLTNLINLIQQFQHSFGSKIDTFTSSPFRLIISSPHMKREHILKTVQPWKLIWQQRCIFFHRVLWIKRGVLNIFDQFLPKNPTVIWSFVRRTFFA